MAGRTFSPHLMHPRRHSWLILLVVLPWMALANRGESIVPICSIQGKGDSSPYYGKKVTTRGIVYADLDEDARRGFYIQKANCDNSTDSSDGIFVYLAERVDVVSLGDDVEVSGKVDEYYGMTELEASAGEVSVKSSGNALPAPLTLNPPFDFNAARVYFESLEGMYVGLPEALTVGPTDASSRSWVVNAALGISRVFQEDARGTGEVICLGDGGSFQVEPQVKVGDRLADVRGALDYEVGEYCVQLVSAPRITQDPQVPATPAVLEPPFLLRLATFNLANLFDTADDPLTDDDVLSAAEYQRRLQKRALALHETLQEPEIVALQEVENDAVLQALVLRPELVAEYGYLWFDGPDARGIDVALLYRQERVQVMEASARQGCTVLQDGLGPDGNGDVHNPQNALTCDRDGDGILDGNRLFSRPPLWVRVWVCPQACGALPQEESGVELWLVVNHFKSKIEDTLTTAFTLPRRQEQAEFVAGMVEDIRLGAPQANLVVLGDLNDYPQSQPLQTLEAVGLANTVHSIPPAQRYTYVFQGISQVLDHILVGLNLPLACVAVETFPINADYPVTFNGVNDSLHRSSDHDPLVIRLKALEFSLFMPQVGK